MTRDQPTVQMGNREIALADIISLTARAGPIGEEDGDECALFLRFEQQSYTRAEVLEIVQVIARIQPDECEMSGNDLRLWWD